MRPPSQPDSIDDRDRHVARAVRRHPLLAAGTAALAVAGIVGGLAAVGSPASAGGQDPSLTVLTIGPPLTVTPTTKPPVLTLVPGFTIPPFATIVTLVPITLVPTSAPGATTTTLAPTTSSAPATTTTTTTPPDDNGNNGNASTAPPATSPPVEPAGITLDILSGTLACDGSVTLQYATTSTPDSGVPVDHTFTFSPLSNPATVYASALNDNVANSQFGLIQALPTAEPYRILVVASFDPDNIDGPKLVDQIDVAPPADCPT